MDAQCILNVYSACVVSNLIYLTLNFKMIDSSDYTLSSLNGPLLSFASVFIPLPTLCCCHRAFKNPGMQLHPPSGSVSQSALLLLWEMPAY